MSKQQVKLIDNLANIQEHMKSRHKEVLVELTDRLTRDEVMLCAIQGLITSLTGKKDIQKEDLLTLMTMFLMLDYSKAITINFNK